MLENLTNLRAIVSEAATSLFKVWREIEKDTEVNAVGYSDTLRTEVLSNQGRLRSSIRELNSSISPRRFFAALEAFENGIDSLSFVDTSSLKDEIGNLSDSYGAFLTTHSYASAQIFLDSALSLRGAIKVFFNLLSGMKENLQSEDASTEENQESLLILLGSELTLDKFAEKLTALNLIYTELCNPFGVSTSEYPVRIAKVESGSLWIKVFGHPKVIPLVTKLIEDTVTFFHRSYTRDGKITTIPRNVEGVEELLKLRKQLRDMGLDTEELDEVIVKASVTVGQQLNKFLGGEMSVTVNDKQYSIEDADLRQKYLEDSRKALPSPMGEDGDNG